MIFKWINPYITNKVMYFDLLGISDKSPDSGSIIYREEKKFLIEKLVEQEKLNNTAAKDSVIKITTQPKTLDKLTTLSRSVVMQATVLKEETKIRNVLSPVIIEDI